jgi:hypothetical protein
MAKAVKPDAPLKTGKLPATPKAPSTNRIGNLGTFAHPPKKGAKKGKSNG